MKRKKPALAASALYLRSSENLHGVDLLHQFGFKVGSLVLVDDGALCQFVDDGEHLGQSFGSNSFVLKGAEVTKGVAHGLGVVTVLYSSLFVGTNSFFCRLVMCHISFMNTLF